MKNRKRLEKIENRKNREKARLLHDRLIKLDSLYYTNDGRLTLAEREEYDKLKNESKEVLNKIPKEKKRIQKIDEYRCHIDDYFGINQHNNAYIV